MIGVMDARHPLAVVTPTLDGDVLARLALAEGSFTPGQLQRLVPDASVDGIRRVLNRLAVQGVVTATRVGSAAITYALNREHLAADSIIALARQGAMLRDKVQARLEGWDYPPSYAAVFGSWARASATTESDVDLLLVRPPDTPDDPWSEQVGRLEDEVSRWTGNDARCFVIDVDRLPEMRDEPVLHSIVREGLTVYGDPAILRRALRGATGAAAQNTSRGGHDAHDAG